MNEDQLGNIVEKIKPQVKIFRYVEDAPRIVASAGKQTLSPKEFGEIYDKMTDEKTNKWIMELIRRGHGSPLEHSIYIFEIVCSRVASHQLVRHRIASYTQLSQRYNDKYLRRMLKLASEKTGIKEPGNPKEYVELIDSIPWEKMDFRDLLDIVGEAFILPPKIVADKDTDFIIHIIKSVREYYRLVNTGVSYEDARFVLPQSVKTRILVSMNARELVENFLPLRMCSHAQWEIRYIAWKLWFQLVNIHPNIFQYTGPRCVYVENRVRTTPCRLTEYLNNTCRFAITRCPELVPNNGIAKCLRYASTDPWTGVSIDS